MTNEEKAKLIVGYEIDTPRNLLRIEDRDACDFVIQMAEHKDRKIQELIDNINLNMQSCNVGDVFGPLYYAGYNQAISDALKMLKELINNN